MDFYEKTGCPKPQPLKNKDQRRNLYGIAAAGSFATWASWFSYGWVSGLSTGFAYFVAGALCVLCYKQGWHSRGIWDWEMRNMLLDQRIRDPFEGVIIEGDPPSSDEHKTA